MLIGVLVVLLWFLYRLRSLSSAIQDIQMTEAMTIEDFETTVVPILQEMTNEQRELRAWVANNIQPQFPSFFTMSCPSQTTTITEVDNEDTADDIVDDTVDDIVDDTVDDTADEQQSDGEYE
jgi:hypothetical protein